MGKDIKRISTAAIDLLLRYPWPGNVRELQNCIERAVILSSDEVIHAHHLPPSLQAAESGDAPFPGKLTAAINALEREMIEDALKSSSGNMAKAAHRLGITERVMGMRVKSYALNLKHFRLS
jgi:Nif-specific regulatory protein